MQDPMGVVCELQLLVQVRSLLTARSPDVQQLNLSSNNCFGEEGTAQ